MITYRPASRGQNLLETSLVLGLVTITAIAALVSSGDQLGGLYNQISGQLANWDGKGPTPTLVSTTVGSGQQNPSLPPVGGNPNGSPGTPYIPTPSQLLGNSKYRALPQNQYQLTLSNGKKIAVMLPEPGDLAETMGPNGVTETYAAFLTQVAAQLEQQQADPKVVASIRDLANQGHVLAEQGSTIDAQLVTLPDATYGTANSNYFDQLLSYARKNSGDSSYIPPASTPEAMMTTYYQLTQQSHANNISLFDQKATSVIETLQQNGYGELASIIQVPSTRIVEAGNSYNALVNTENANNIWGVKPQIHTQQGTYVAETHQQSNNICAYAGTAQCIQTPAH